MEDFSLVVASKVQRGRNPFSYGIEVRNYGSIKWRIKVFSDFSKHIKLRNGRIFVVQVFYCYVPISYRNGSYFSQFESDLL